MKSIRSISKLIHFPGLPFTVSYMTVVPTFFSIFCFLYQNCIVFFLRWLAASSSRPLYHPLICSGWTNSTQVQKDMSELGIKPWLNWYRDIFELAHTQQIAHWQNETEWMIDILDLQIAKIVLFCAQICDDEKAMLKWCESRQDFLQACYSFRFLTSAKRKDGFAMSGAWFWTIKHRFSRSAANSADKRP